jgi:biopolymer transport protein ExbB
MLVTVFVNGGFVFYIILVSSILSFSIICFKIIEFFIKSRIKKNFFMEKLIEKIKDGKIKDAISFCDTEYSPIAEISKIGLISLLDGNDDEIDKILNREVMIQTFKLEKFVTVLGIIGNIIVYVGLLGTILGIIKVFSSISLIGSNDISVVVGGVSEALIATAASLLVAVPSTVAYNLFLRCINKFVFDMEWCVSLLEDLLKVDKSNV